MQRDRTAARSDPTPELRARNRRLGLILGAIALAIFVGFIARSVYFAG